jgi:hypothetical protein
MPVTSVDAEELQVAGIGYEDVDSLVFVDKFAIRADLVSNVRWIRSVCRCSKIAMLDRRGMVRSTWSALSKIQASYSTSCSAEAVARDDAIGRGVR